MPKLTRAVVSASAVLALVLVGCSTPSAQADPSQSVATPSPTEAPSATPEPTKTPRPTIRPRATASPTPTPPPTEDIVLVDYGFSTFQGEFDDGANLSWALIIENPNEELVATGLSLNVSFLDAAGSVVTTANENIALALPGTQVAATGSDSYFSNPDLASIATMEVQMASPDFEEPDGPVGAFEISDIATRTGEFGQVTTTARVTSTFRDEIEQPMAVVVYFNEADEVIGGDFTFVDFVPAGGSIPIEIGGFGSVPGIASSDVYITFSNLSL